MPISTQPAVPSTNGIAVRGLNGFGRAAPSTCNRAPGGVVSVIVRGLRFNWYTQPRSSPPSSSKLTPTASVVTDCEPTWLIGPTVVSDVPNSSPLSRTPLNPPARSLIFWYESTAPVVDRNIT